jgi:hypothetical protein
MVTIMEKYTASTLKTRLTSIAAANDNSRLQEVFVNVVYQSLVMGNNLPEQVKAVRDSAAPSAFKSGLLKHLPLVWNKTNEQYEYKRERAEQLRTRLGLELAGATQCATIDDVAAKLPDLFAKKETVPAEFNAEEYAVRVGLKLTKEGYDGQNIGDLLSLLLARPELLKAATQGAAEAMYAADEAARTGEVNHV